MFRAVLPQMRKQKSGHILSISSVSALSASAGLGFYAATKSALESLHQAEAPMLLQWNIKLTILQPGTIRTNNLHMAEKVEVGTRIYSREFGEQDLYGKQISAKKKDYVTYVYYAGAPVSETTELISTIITNPESTPPVLQTEGEAKFLSEKYLVDPSWAEHFEDELAQTTHYLTEKT